MEENFHPQIHLCLVRIITSLYFRHLFIIGFLGPVTNINASIENCTNISIYWDSPTLDDYRVSILYYHLSIYNDNLLVKSVSVYGTSYQFENQDLFIHRYTYVITGVNELGEGISNNITCSYQKGIIIVRILIIILLFSS